MKFRNSIVVGVFLCVSMGIATAQTCTHVAQCWDDVDELRDDQRPYVSFTTQDAPYGLCVGGGINNYVALTCGLTREFAGEDRLTRYPLTIDATLDMPCRTDWSWVSVGGSGVLMLSGGCNTVHTLTNVCFTGNVGILVTRGARVRLFNCTGLNVQLQGGEIEVAHGCEFESLQATGDGCAHVKSSQFVGPVDVANWNGALFIESCYFSARSNIRLGGNADRSFVIADSGIAFPSLEMRDNVGFPESHLQTCGTEFAPSTDAQFVFKCNAAGTVENNSPDFPNGWDFEGPANCVNNTTTVPCDYTCGTPTPTPTSTVTPTPTVTATATPTITPSATATATPFGMARVLLAGYWDTRLKVGVPGTVTVYALADTQTLSLVYTPTGERVATMHTNIYVDLPSGRVWQHHFAVGEMQSRWSLSLGLDLYGLGNRDPSWPYLTVNP